MSEQKSEHGRRAASITLVAPEAEHDARDRPSIAGLGGSCIRRRRGRCSDFEPVGDGSLSFRSSRELSHASSVSSRYRIAPPGSRIAGRSPRRVQRKIVSALTPSMWAAYRAVRRVTRRPSWLQDFEPVLDVARPVSNRAADAQRARAAVNVPPVAKGVLADSEPTGDLSDGEKSPGGIVGVGSANRSWM